MNDHQSKHLDAAEDRIFSFDCCQPVGKDLSKLKYNLLASYRFNLERKQLLFIPDVSILASYPFNLERKKNFYVFPMKLDEKNGFRGKTVF